MYMHTCTEYSTVLEYLSDQATCGIDVSKNARFATRNQDQYYEREKRSPKLLNMCISRVYLWRGVKAS